MKHLCRRHHHLPAISALYSSTLGGREQRGRRGEGGRGTKGRGRGGGERSVPDPIRVDQPTARKVVLVHAAGVAQCQGHVRDLRASGHKGAKGRAVVVVHKGGHQRQHRRKQRDGHKSQQYEQSARGERGVVGCALAQSAASRKTKRSQHASSPKTASTPTQPKSKPHPRPAQAQAHRVVNRPPDVDERIPPAAAQRLSRDRLAQHRPCEEVAGEGGAFATNAVVETPGTGTNQAGDKCLYRPATV